jgi:phosphotransferase system HPr (HPr) family protein
MQKITLQVINEVGLHARPASEFVKLAGQFKADLQVRNKTTGSKMVDAKSILSVLMLGVEKGHEIELTSEGEDGERAIQALRKLIESDFAGMF